MLGSPCSPCCGAPCSSAFAFFLQQTPTVTISGSTPGQEAATVVSQYYNADTFDRTAQDLHSVIASRAPQAGESPDSQGRPVIAVYFPRTAEMQRQELDSLNAYFVQYFKANGNANGTHQLALDLGATYGSNGVGVVSYRKTTADYRIVLNITIGGGPLGGPGTATVPNVSCPIDIRLDLRQYSYSQFGSLSPSMVEASTPSLLYTLPDTTVGLYEPLQINATPIARWPSSEYTSLNGAAMPDANGRYDTGDFRHFYSSDLSAQNIAVRFDYLTSTRRPAAPQPVDWSQVQSRETMSYGSNARATVPLAVGNGVATYLIDGYPNGSGANVWRQVSASQALRQPLSVGGVSWSAGRGVNILGFTTRSPVPSPAGVAYVQRLASPQEMSVYLNLGHP